MLERRCRSDRPGTCSANVRREELTHTEKTHKRALAAARAPVERGVARLKSWRIFRRSRCSPNCMSSIAKAVLTLELQR
ncbi:transposase family protein [Streptomyces sp. NPDC053780]|uniref:transposase family protein n=1 Tax=unclassified Streptomyces TaxID=2593676 RepID=UPI00343DF70B